MVPVFLGLEDDNQSDVVVVHSLIQIKNMQFPEW